MKTTFPSLPARTSLHPRLMPLWVAAALACGWGSAVSQASESHTGQTIPPPPEVKLEKIPVLRLQKVHQPAKSKSSPKQQPKKTAAQHRQKKTVVTGSNIPQSVDVGRSLASASNILVIDRREMSRTGAQTASQLFGRMTIGR